MKAFLTKLSLLLTVCCLVACGGSANKKSSNPSTGTGPSSSSAASSIPAVTVMEANKEYPYTDSTEITNTGTTSLVVEKKHYWDGNKTVVILKEGSATIK